MADRSPQAEASTEKVEQFPLRLPAGMRDQIKAAAKANQRSMNAEIVDRLERHANVDLYQEVLAQERFDHQATRRRLVDETARLETEMQILAKQLHDATEEAKALREKYEALQTEGREEADRRKAVLDNMWEMLRQMDSVHKISVEELHELAEIAKFLQGDQFDMQFELFPDPDAPEGFKPTSPAPSLSTLIGKQIAEYVDLRMLRIARLTRGLSPAAARAKVMSHHICLSDEEREVASMFVEQGADEGEAADFYDFVKAGAADAPDEYRAKFEGALDKMMPKLFSGWTSPAAEDGGLF